MAVMHKVYFRSLTFRIEHENLAKTQNTVLHPSEAIPRTPRDRHKYPILHRKVPPRRPSWKVERSVALYHQRSYHKDVFLQ